MLLNKIEQIVKNEPNNMKLGKKIRSLFWDVWDERDIAKEESPYIFESPDGETVFRRRANDYNPEHKEEIVDGKPTGRTFNQYSNGNWKE
jgi:hypothetical protein